MGKNHFVPRLYLKRWSEDGVNIQAYRLLVSHENVPAWKPRAISGLAYVPGLYTDEMEKWFEREYETPAEEALEKVWQDIPLNAGEWKRLIYFAAAQDIRTPSQLVENTHRWQRELPQLLERTLSKAVKKLEHDRRKGKTIPVRKQRTAPMSFPARMIVEPAEDGQHAMLGLEVTPGPELWFLQMRLLMEGAAKFLLRHRWSILHAHPSTEWFTTDHPVLRLNYYGDGSYDFGGGWGNPGSEILFPLSPRHLMYTKVGGNFPDGVCSAEMTFKLQQLFAARAPRWIFARKPLARIAMLRPRHVSAEAFKAEERLWKEWGARTGTTGNSES